MEARWVRKPKGDTTVVFVHGILSSGEKAWTNSRGVSWPELLSQEPDLDAIGIYVHTYQTSILSGSYSLDDAVDDLKERFRLDGLNDAARLIFVCHSMGGLVVRRYLVRQAIELRERNVDLGLFLVASPSLGSTYANWLSSLASVLGNVQVDALRFSENNLWLNSLDVDFINLKEMGTLRLRGKELMEDKVIPFKGRSWLLKAAASMVALFWRRPVVEAFSAGKYFGERYKVPLSDHVTISKPEGPGAIQHLLLCQFIRDMVPAEVPARALVLIDDEPAVGEAVRLAVENFPGLSLKVVTDVSTKEGVYRALSHLTELDGAIVDFEVPAGGVQVYEYLKASRPNLPVIFYTRHANRPETFNHLLAVGINPKDIFAKQKTATEVPAMVRRFEQHWALSNGQGTVSQTDRVKNETAGEQSTAESDNETIEAELSMATVEGVGACLREFEVANILGTGKWADILERGEPEFGEIRDPSSWFKLREGEQVRVVLLRDSRGLALRWWSDPALEASIRETTEQMTRAEGSPFEQERATRLRQELESRIITHQHLASYEPTTLGELRSGYVVRNEDRLAVYGNGRTARFRLPGPELPSTANE